MLMYVWVREESECVREKERECMFARKGERYNSNIDWYLQKKEGLRDIKRKRDTREKEPNSRKRER